MNYASRRVRFLAQAVDTAIGFGPLFAGAVLESQAGGLSALLLAPVLLWIPFYILCADAFPNGQSVGKRLLKIRVEDIDTGKPCTYGQSILRNFLLCILGPIDWVFVFGEEHQRLGDRAASTVVVRAE